jgi:hypothetical protein
MVGKAHMYALLRLGAPALACNPLEAATGGIAAVDETCGKLPDRAP